MLKILKLAFVLSFVIFPSWKGVNVAVKNVNEQNFEKEIATGFVVVDFYATWCGPCEILTPILHEISSERSDVAFIEIDVDKAQETAKKFGITAFPTVVFLKNGKEVGRFIGVHQKSEIISMLDQYR